MGRTEVEFVAGIRSLLSRDLKPAVEDDEFAAALYEVVDPEARVRFVDPEGGALGDRRVPEGGVEGLREGWRDWLEPWEHFWIGFGDPFDARDARVLSLADLRGEMRGGVELTQPGAAII